MTTFDYILLVFSALCMATAIGYGFWARIRVVNLQTDFMKIVVDLEKERSAAGLPSDDAYVHARNLAVAAIDGAEWFSFPTMACIWAMTPNLRPPRSENPMTQEIADRGAARVVRRLSQYLIRETVTGWLLTVIFGMVPRKVAQQGVRETVGKSLGNIPFLTRKQHPSAI